MGPGLPAGFCPALSARDGAAAFFPLLCGGPPRPAMEECLSLPQISLFFSASQAVHLLRVLILVKEEPIGQRTRVRSDAPNKSGKRTQSCRQVTGIELFRVLYDEPASGACPGAP